MKPRFESQEEREQFDQMYQKCLADLKDAKHKFMHLRNIFLILFAVFIYNTTHGYTDFLYVIGGIFVLFFFIAKRQYKNICILEVDKWWYETPYEELFKMVGKLGETEKMETPNHGTIRKLNIFEKIIKIFTV